MLGVDGFWRPLAAAPFFEELLAAPSNPRHPAPAVRNGFRRGEASHPGANDGCLLQNWI